MSIFKSPSDYPWPFVIVLYVVGFALACYWLGLDLPRHTWSIPSKNDLVFAEGRFTPIKKSVKAPYEFVTSDGHSMEFGCLPESAMATCIDDAGIDLRSLSQKTLRVGYFNVPNFRAIGLSNIIMTLVATDGSSIFAYGYSRKKFEDWSIREEEIKHSALTLGFDILIPSAFFAFAVYLTWSKWKSR